MRLSRERTTRRLTPTHSSQTRSSVPFGKRSVSRSTLAPAARSASTTTVASSDSSRKRVSGSGGGELELAAEGGPDRFLFGTAGLCQVPRQVAGLELFGEPRRRDRRPGGHRAAERHARVD